MTKPKNYPFVEPEIAILADKHHGFAFYDPSDLNYYYNIDLGDEVLYKEEDCEDIYCYAAAPLYQQLIDWLREEHFIHISITPDWVYDEDTHNSTYDEWYYELENLSKDKRAYTGKKGTKENYYDALQEAIKKAFELI